MTVLEALQKTTVAIKNWVESKFADITADDMGVYVRDTEPSGAVAGDIWINTSQKNAPVLCVKTSDGTWQEVAGTTGGNTGGDTTPKLTSVTMRASAWAGSNDLYSQVVNCSGVTINSKLDLQPTPAQIVELQYAEVSLMLSNTDGVVTAWAIGGTPDSDMTMDVMITEVLIV